MRGSGAIGADELGAMAARPRMMRFERVLGWILAIALGVSVGQSQFLSVDYRMQAEEERASAEHERWRQLEAAYEARRARAHARLGSAASSVESQALCPAFVGPTPATRTVGTNAKIPIRPFMPRSARRPTTARWSEAAPATESPASLFSDYISQPVVQARCINCHVEGGVSDHTRLVLTPSSTKGHESLNLAVFENLVATVEHAADLVLNKIQGVGHGGGIQVPAGSADFANMERFLRLLGGETSSAGLSPETLFDGVTMASPAKTLRRAALMFAGRLPTQAELNSVNDGHDASLRQAVRDLMIGPGFHEFLIRASNDRLLTDRHLGDVIDANIAKEFVELGNKSWELVKAAYERGIEERGYDPDWNLWNEAVQFGFARAPLELIAHVVENDLPYTEILTADYVMANPLAAEAYGASTQFENASDMLEFKPSEITAYYRNDDSKVYESSLQLGTRVINPGNLATDYPHAGILNTTVFLRRYPTTATNRNRARSRWTYYQFLGLDIEKSAARTTDPDALADTDNPTMNNSACAVCHSVLDPVAGAFQNYGDDGLFRHKHGGLDSLPDLYKYPEDGSVSPYQDGDTWFRDMREPGFGGAVAPSADNSLQWLARRIVADDRFAEAAVKFWWPAILGEEVSAPPEDERDSDFEALLLASTAQAAEVTRLAAAFRTGIAGGPPYMLKDLLAEITLSPWFRAESVTGRDPVRAAALRNVGVARLLTPEELDRKTEAVSGYVWRRRLREHFGVGQPRTALNDFEARQGYGLLYGGIDSDGITERARDMTPLMAMVAQTHAAEVSCPIVQREFYFWPEERRRLFSGIDPTITPIAEFYGATVIDGKSWSERETVSLTVSFSPGDKTVRLRFPNNFWDPEAEVTRNLVVDELIVRDHSGSTIVLVELETLEAVDLDSVDHSTSGGCDGWPYYNQATQRVDGYELNYCLGWLDIPISIPAEGSYSIEVVAFQLAAGDESARLEIMVESDSDTSQGALAIRRKLVELHEKLLGVAAAIDSPDVNAAYGLYADVWNRMRQAQGGNFRDAGFNCDGGDHLYYEGLVDDPLRFSDFARSELNWDRLGEFYERIEMSDPNHSVRAWVVTLAYLLTDYRYLHF